MHQAIDSIHERPGAQRSVWGRRLTAALLVLLAGSGTAAADDGVLRDCTLTVRARQALLQDSTLAPLNLGVTVRAGVATLWGETPSAWVGRRAEEKGKEEDRSPKNRPRREE